MPRSRKIFIAFIALFIVVIGWLVYDISSRTTFPGSKRRNTGGQDTSRLDSGRSVHR